MVDEQILEDIFSNLRDTLDKMDSIREKLLPLQRTTVRWCSEIIKKVHRQEYDTISTKITNAKINLQDMEELVKGTPNRFPHDYLRIVKQELGEAIIFYEIVANNKFPTPDECTISGIDYAYALCDVAGELRRYILSLIRKEKIELAANALNLMDQIYTYLFTLDYPNGLIPQLRPKIDKVRKILANTEGDVTVSMNVLKLTKNLAKLNKLN